MYESMAFNQGVIRVQNAFIEEIFNDRNVGQITISYGELADFDIIYMNVVTLIVGRQTVIRDQFGQNLSLWDLREGMTIDAVFSSAMTRRIPPQSQAFLITVVNNTDFSVTVGQMHRVDLSNGFLYTGRANDPLSQMRFVITQSTLILNRRGDRINLSNLRPGQTVRVEHATFQTASIPPQTTAFKVQVL
jgi:hypothetical protein